MESKSLQEVAIYAAKQAGEILLSHYGTAFKHHYKDQEPANTCTEIDLAANNCILEIIQKEFPDHGILSEEEKPRESSSDYTWVVDPLDGTNNYLHGLPLFSVSIAVFHKQQPAIGVIYQPLGDILFQAELGQGAWKIANGQKQSLNCSSTDLFSEAMIGLGFYYDRGEMMRSTLKSIERFFAKEVHGIRRLGCASLDLCYVASGHFDVFFENTLSPWDFAAGMLMVTESGGQISTTKGAALGLVPSSVLASNGVLHQAAIDLLSES